MPSRTERNAGLPTYEYAANRCEENFDVVQSFHDDPLTACPTCGSPVRKVFGNVGIVFKGSGFYKTDSRNGGSAKKQGADASDPGVGGRGRLGLEAATAKDSVVRGVLRGGRSRRPRLDALGNNVEEPGRRQGEKAT